MKKTRFALVRLVASLAAIFVAILPGAAQEEGAWEKLIDGSIGKVTEYRGVNDTPIAAYLGKPKSDGPFPVVVIVRGGKNSKEGTYALGRLTESPTASFIAKHFRVPERSGSPSGSRAAPQSNQAPANAVGAPVIPNRLRTPIREQLAQGKVPWNDSRTANAEGMHLKRYRSDIIKSDISYLIYLPSSYENEPPRRFPVVYWLHGGGGSQRDCWKFLEQVKKRNADGSCPEMIVVGVNGIASSIYSDSKDGKLPFESVIIEELIPHVDRNYRTIADRSGRALEGFSMGGFGVFHLGFKFPEMFGVLTGLGPALLEFDSGAGNVEGALRNGPYEGDREYFKVNDPFHLVEKNAAAIRGRTAIRLLDNEQTSSFTFRRTQELIALLKKLNIACDYRRLAGSGHNYERYYNEYPGSVAFYATAFKAK